MPGGHRASSNTSEEGEAFSGGDVQVQEGQPVFENVELQPFPSLSVLK